MERDEEGKGDHGREVEMEEPHQLFGWFFFVNEKGENMRWACPHVVRAPAPSFTAQGQRKRPLPVTELLVQLLHYQSGADRKLQNDNRWCQAGRS